MCGIQFVAEGIRFLLDLVIDYMRKQKNCRLRFVEYSNQGLLKIICRLVQFDLGSISIKISSRCSARNKFDNNSHCSADNGQHQASIKQDILPNHSMYIRLDLKGSVTGCRLFIQHKGYSMQLPILPLLLLFVYFRYFVFYAS